MCTHLHDISIMNYMLLVKSAKSFDDEQKQMKKDKTCDYMFCHCDICNKNDEQLGNTSYYLKCPICEKIICDNCQNFVSYHDVTKLNEFLKITNLNVDCVLYCNDCYEYYSVISKYKCERCNKTYNKCVNCKKETIKIYEDCPEYICMQCFHNIH